MSQSTVSLTPQGVAVSDLRVGISGSSAGGSSVQRMKSAFIELLRHDMQFFVDAGIPRITVISEADLKLGSRRIATPEQAGAYAEAVLGGHRRNALRVLYEAMGIEDVDQSFDRGGAHDAPGPEDGAPMWDIAQGIYPEDAYSARMHEYGSGDVLDQHAFSAIRRVEGRPNAFCTVYRAVDKGVKSILPGDWVTPSRAYAVRHAKNNITGPSSILSKTVHARDLFTDGNSILEWGYHPQERKPEFPRTAAAKTYGLQERLDAQLPYLEQVAIEEPDRADFTLPDGGSVCFIAERVPFGEERDVLLRQALSYVCFPGPRNRAAVDVLADRVKGWARAEEGSVERMAFKAASTCTARKGLVGGFAKAALVPMVVKFALETGVSPAPGDGTRSLGAWLRDFEHLVQCRLDEAFGDDQIAVPPALLASTAFLMTGTSDWPGEVASVRPAFDVAIAQDPAVLRVALVYDWSDELIAYVAEAKHHNPETILQAMKAAGDALSLDRLRGGDSDLLDAAAKMLHFNDIQDLRQFVLEHPSLSAQMAAAVAKDGDVGVVVAASSTEVVIRNAGDELLLLDRSKVDAPVAQGQILKVEGFGRASAVNPHREESPAPSF